MWDRRGGEIPEAWFRLPIFYFSNVSELRGPGDPVWAPKGSEELDFELEVGAIVDTPAYNLPAGARRARRSAATASSMTGPPATCSATSRPSGSGPAKGKDFALTIGPWIVTPDELADRWRAGRDRPGPGDDRDASRR